MSQPPGSLPAGTRLHNGTVVQTVDEYLTDRARHYITVLERDRAGKLTDPSDGRLWKLTRADWGNYRGRLEATIDALLAVRAGSGYFMNQARQIESHLTTQVLGELGYLGPREPTD